MPEPKKSPSHRPGPVWSAFLAVLTVGLLSACEQPTQPGDVEVAASVNRASAAATYEISVENAAGALQPLTPSVIALHTRAAEIFRVGHPASSEVERVAESGNLDPLLSALEGDGRVFDVAVAFGAGGPILPGETASVTLDGPPGRGLRLSLISMLVCTNDGFTGLSSVSLPSRVGESRTFMVDAYDAGTEQNTEADTDLVPPCVMATTGSAGGTGADQPSVAESDVIRHHPGIDADTDGNDILVPDTHQWGSPVAVIEIERVR